MLRRSHSGAVSVTDLAAVPKIDRDHPPDLKQLADSAAVVDVLKTTAAPASSGTAPPAAKAAGKAAARAGGKGPAAMGAGGLPPALDVTHIVNSVVTRVRLWCHSAVLHHLLTSECQPRHRCWQGQPADKCVVVACSVYQPVAARSRIVKLCGASRQMCAWRSTR